MTSPQAIAGVIWLGALTSIQPCPMANNIVAMAYVARHVASGPRLLLCGLFYTAGRMLAYFALGFVVVAGLLSVPGVAAFLRTYMNRLLGPALIIVGIVLAGLVPWKPSSGSVPAPGQWQRLGGGGLLASTVLGFVLALSFCPIPAGIFFGSVVPLALSERSSVLLPAMFGVGTALPVLVLAVLLAISRQAVGKAFERLRVVERWARPLTGAVFIVVGAYQSLVYVFNVL